VAVRRAPLWRAGFAVYSGLLTCAWLPPTRLVAISDSSLIKHGVVTMKKIVPDPPALSPHIAAQCDELSLGTGQRTRGIVLAKGHPA